MLARTYTCTSKHVCTNKHIEINLIFSCGNVPPRIDCIG